MSQSPETANRLIHETSPYLRQHAHNPVDWYPWGARRLRKARELDRPIFLAIGYSRLPLVPRHGARELREREIAQIAQRALRQHQGRSRGTARPRSDLHDGRADADAARRLADVGVPDARPASRFTAAPTSRPRTATAGPASGDCCSTLAEAWKSAATDIERAGRPRSPTHLRQISGASRRPAESATQLAPTLLPQRRTARRSLRLHARRLRPGTQVPAPDGPAAAACGCANASATTTPCTWPATRWTAWRRAASTIISAAASIATAPTNAGWCPTSRRCSTTTPCSSSPISRRIRSPATPFYREIVEETLDYVSAK